MNIPSKLFAKESNDEEGTSTFTFGRSYEDDDLDPFAGLQQKQQFAQLLRKQSAIDYLTQKPSMQPKHGVDSNVKRLDQIIKSKKPKQIITILKYATFCYLTTIISTVLVTSLINYAFDNYSILDFIVTTIMIILYLSSIIAFLIIIIYVRLHQYKSYEYLAKRNLLTSQRIYFSLRSEEISFYLKVGVIGIGMASVIYSLFQFEADYRASDPACRVPLNPFYYLFQCIFFTIEIYFIVDYNSLVVLNNCPQARVLFVHIILTNVCTWLRACLTKVSKIGNLDRKQLCQEIEVSYYSNYFLPCVSEFTIIATAIMYDIFKRIGNYTFINTETHHHDSIFVDLQKSKTGVAITIFIILSTFELLLGMFNLRDQLDNTVLIKFHIFEEIFFYSMTLILSFILNRQIKRLVFSYPYYTNHIDVNLLYVSAFFSIMFGIQLLQFCIEYLSERQNGNEFTMKYSGILIMRLSSVVVELVGIFMQTYVINDCFHRCFNEDGYQKPGRTAIIMLIGINLSLWIMKSFQSKIGDIFINGDLWSESNTTPYTMIVYFFFYMNMPMSILYRYHSSVCFADIFSKMYHSEIERLTDILRAEEFSHLFVNKPEEETKQQKISLSVHSEVV